MQFCFWEEISASTNQASACSFLQKLWKIVGSHRQGVLPFPVQWQ